MLEHGLIFIHNFARDNLTHAIKIKKMSQAPKGRVFSLSLSVTATSELGLTKPLILFGGLELHRLVGGRPRDSEMEGLQQLMFS